MIRRYFILAIFIAFLVPFFTQCSHIGSSAIKTHKAGDVRFYKDTKFTIGEIEGSPKAVGILEGSLINSLMNTYTAEKETADYAIEGNVFGKGDWKTGRFVYNAVNLRVVDKEGNVLMTLRNQERFTEQSVDEFTKNLVVSLKEQMR